MNRHKNIDAIVVLQSQVLNRGTRCAVDVDFKGDAAPPFRANGCNPDSLFIQVENLELLRNSPNTCNTQYRSGAYRCGAKPRCGSLVNVSLRQAVRRKEEKGTGCFSQMRIVT
jgi:hypothetical protein